MEVREPAVAYGKRKYSIGEYLEIEHAATEKHEYYKGEIFAMSGAKLPHNNICGNLYANLWNKLKGKSCKPYNSETRIHIERNSLFTYPDISVVCGEVLTLNNDDYNVLNPTVLLEVLSPGTRKYDQGEKFELYRDIATLREYITIDSEALAVEAWRLNEQGEWILKTHCNINEMLILQSVGVSLTLDEIYEGIQF